MAIFKNDLDLYISMIQTDEILESQNSRLKRHNKEMALCLAISTGAIATTTGIALHYDKPETLLINLVTIAIVKSLFNLYTFRKIDKLSYKMDYKNFELPTLEEYRKMLRSNREKARYLGSLKYQSASKYHRKNAEDIEFQFGFESDNNLPINFLEKEKVPNQVLKEYEMFNKKYELPELKVTEEELVIFISELENWLKTKTLSHRIYHYTSHYLKVLLAKGLINYWDEITTNTLTEYLKYIEPEEFTEEEVNEFKTHLIDVFEEYKQSHKLTK